jgi:hypothetical protein
MKRERSAYIYLLHSVQEFRYNIAKFCRPYTQDFIRENQTAQGRRKKFVNSKTTRNNGA